ncbi:MAG: sigma-54-dependent Fis family transcriptional regulator [Planctomycetes bacterium]|nr:sigma-54-dependent Fis family transcriptional regulator [Planctomycetota bacterium]
MNEPLDVLFADDDEVFRRTLSRALTRRGCSVRAAAGGAEALQLLNAGPAHVALLDLRMPGMDGLELMRALRLRDKHLPVVILTGHGSVPSAIEAIRSGAFDYLQKPCDAEEVAATLRLAARTRSAHATGSARLLGDSPAMTEVRTTIARTADSWSPVLILGESGSGKSLVAEVLHGASSRRDHPFITLDCASPRPDLLEAELFGTATPGAAETRGLLDSADGGMLFIDQIALLSPGLQAGLLRVVESGYFRPLGSSTERHVKVRFVAASDKDLVAEGAAGRFRKELLWRLDVVRIVLPPLRERRGDIAALALAWIAASQEAAARGVTLSADALALLSGAAWPGNVRELLHALERSVLLANGGALDAAGLRSTLGLQPQRWISNEAVPHGETLGETERRHIVAMLEREGGNVSRVSEMLGIDRRTLQRKMKRLGLR